jgi:hypothetical protein
MQFLTEVWKASDGDRTAFVTAIKTAYDQQFGVRPFLPLFKPVPKVGPPLSSSPLPSSIFPVDVNPSVQ